jgi:Disulphide bond corrector protein DsbC
MLAGYPRMKPLRPRRSIFALLVTASAALVLRAQIVPANPPAHSPIATASVAYLYPTQVTIPAGKPSPVALHFRVASGLHINSHTPSNSFLIPTTLAFPAGMGVHLEAATYPAGSEIALPVDPTTKLSVYTGEFVIHARILAEAGHHAVQASLHYQACNDNECLPPKTITVPIDVISR